MKHLVYPTKTVTPQCPASGTSSSSANREATSHLSAHQRTPQVSSLKMSPLILSLVAVATLCGFSPASADRWTDFQEKHIVKVAPNLVGEDFCTKTIKDMKINKGLFCKPRHKFINEKPETILATCITKMYTNVESGAAYNVIQCDLDKVTEPPKCVYKTQKLKRHVLLECGDKQPVQFQKILDD
ncbi:hypothetical protein NDU88_005400 [Pleurodeles waltl]|uniref:Ribonuclease A-domain domain-containing protein n=1 Tax=Pleurodeles waltl TaxID=8319 RepID=A0AAV7TAV8_PLEWA|nr:hypothetical protein NDU88_005400 [Pleurodeles waltl]KAJ1173570.1 hypothetical protein NDU88_005400 [Pleurodeles waltl]